MTKSGLERLGARTLQALKASVARPDYDPQQHGVGMVHLGLGAFHRAHQAVYNDAVMARDGGHWRVLGVSLRSSQVRDALLPQDCLFSVGIRDGESEQIRIVGAIADVLVAPESPSAVINALAAPQISVITLTVTEKGYCLRPADGCLDTEHPDIRHDLAYPEQPRSALGFLCAALRQRAIENHPVNIISCDNLAANGRKLQAAVEAMLTLQSPEVLSWCREAVAFPCTMVDRIVPMVDADTVRLTATALGCVDQACVKTEVFTQWVIEDRFTAPRPCWEAVGVLIVDDVERYETNKLRLLNGAHSALAYTGLLSGYHYVHEAMNDPVISCFIQGLMDCEVLPTLESPLDFDLAGYAAELRQRFANVALNDPLARIAMDGSQKIPLRWLPVLLARLRAGEAVEHLCLALASWYRVMGTSGAPRYSVADPLAAELEQRLTDGDAAHRYRQLLTLSSVLGPELSDGGVFESEMQSAFSRTEGVYPGALS